MNQNLESFCKQQNQEIIKLKTEIQYLKQIDELKRRIGNLIQANQKLKSENERLLKQLDQSSSQIQQFQTNQLNLSNSSKSSFHMDLYSESQSFQNSLAQFSEPINLQNIQEPGHFNLQFQNSDQSSMLSDQNALPLLYKLERHNQPAKVLNLEGFQYVSKIERTKNKSRHEQEKDIFYLLTDNFENQSICAKIHMFNAQVYVDFRRYRINKQTKRIDTQWQGEMVIGPIPKHVLNSKLPGVLKGGGICLVDRIFKIVISQWNSILSDFNDMLHELQNLRSQQQLDYDELIAMQMQFEDLDMY